MKTKKYIIGLLLCSLLGSQVLSAQETMGEQNPNYRVSMDKYMVLKDSITLGFGTTVQNTYKAYDWYEAKQERKALRKQNRHEVRMARAENAGYYGYIDGYNYNYYGFGSNYYGYRNNWGLNLVPRVGFNTGNWSFWW